MSKNEQVKTTSAPLAGVLTLAEETTMSSAHFLPFYAGECSNVHGHTWRIRARWRCLTTDKDAVGIAIDFKALKIALRVVTRKLDHNLLNKTILQPTAENIAEHIYHELQKSATASEHLLDVQVYESPTSSVRYDERRLIDVECT